MDASVISVQKALQHKVSLCGRSTSVWEQLKGRKTDLKSLPLLPKTAGRAKRFSFQQPSQPADAHAPAPAPAPAPDAPAVPSTVSAAAAEEAPGDGADDELDSDDAIPEAAARPEPGILALEGVPPVCCTLPC